MFRPGSGGAAPAIRSGADVGGFLWGSQLGAGLSGAWSLSMLLRPVSREAALSIRPGANGGGLLWATKRATRQVSASPQQSESPSKTGVEDAVAGGGLRASGAGNVERLQVPHGDRDKVRCTPPALTESLDEGSAKQM